MEAKVAAVVVTYNRIEYLKKCIGGLRNQSRKLDEIIIVNNSSTDGSVEWLSKQTDITVITQPNTGSAGGQFTGIKSAYDKGYDWIWCLDADVVPDQNALQMFLTSDVMGDKSLGFLSSTIYTPENSLCYINIPYLENSNSMTKFNCLKILSASFGSVLFSRNAIKTVGYPIPDFFIWGDDAEYTFRMREKGFNGYLIAESKATHFEQNNFPNPFLEMNYLERKAFFAVRNTIYIIKLRNRILYKSYIRGIASSLLFYFDIILKRSKRKKWDMNSLIKFSRYFVSGLVYNPRKFLNNETN